MHIEDKDYARRIDGVQWVVAIGVGGLLTHLAYIAIWHQAITLGAFRTFRASHSEGTRATIAGFLLLAIACFFFCALFEKQPRIPRFKRRLISAVCFAAFGIVLCFLRPVT